MSDERCCLQCTESQAAIRASQQAKNPIYCADEDYFGECTWEADRHRFRDWSNKELAGMGVKPEFYDEHRRILSMYDVPFDHWVNPPHGRCTDCGEALEFVSMSPDGSGCDILAYTVDEMPMQATYTHATYATPISGDAIARWKAAEREGQKHD